MITVIIFNNINPEDFLFPDFFLIIILIFGKTNTIM